MDFVGVKVRSLGMGQWRRLRPRFTAKWGRRGYSCLAGFITFTWWPVPGWSFISLTVLLEFLLVRYSGASGLNLVLNDQIIGPLPPLLFGNKKDHAHSVFFMLLLSFSARCIPPPFLFVLKLTTPTTSHVTTQQGLFSHTRGPL